MGRFWIWVEKGRDVEEEEEGVCLLQIHVEKG